jgi:release factor glutamine methyltransferase
MSDAEKWTIGRLLTWTSDYLSEHDSDSPRLDAEILLGHILGLERINLYVNINDEPSDEQKARFRELIKQRAAGAPVAYLVEEKEFFSIPLRVTPAVLIPRPETELLVLGAVDFARSRSSDTPLELCDVGTGSGAVSIAIAKNVKECSVTAVDISLDALAVAKFNVAKHGLEDRIELIESDVMESIAPERTFDLVVSNPPYVTEAEMKELPVDVGGYEPHTALSGGKDGLDVIRRLISQSEKRLRPGGELLFELSPMIHDVAIRLFEGNDAWRVEPTIQDNARLNRIVRVARNG